MSCQKHHWMFISVFLMKASCKGFSKCNTRLLFDNYVVQRKSAVSQWKRSTHIAFTYCNQPMSFKIFRFYTSIICFSSFLLRSTHIDGPKSASRNLYSVVCITITTSKSIDHHHQATNATYNCT